MIIVCTSGVIVLHITHTHRTCQKLNKCLIKNTSYLWATYLLMGYLLTYLWVTYLPQIGAIKKVSIGVSMCPSTKEAFEVSELIVIDEHSYKP